MEMPTAQMQSESLDIPKKSSRASMCLEVYLRPVNAATIKEA